MNRCSLTTTSVPVAYLAGGPWDHVVPGGKGAEEVVLGKLGKGGGGGGELPSPGFKEGNFFGFTTSPCHSHG